MLLFIIICCYIIKQIINNLMIIKEAAYYGILEDYPSEGTIPQLKEIRYLIEETICDHLLVLPLNILEQPKYNKKTQRILQVNKLNEGYIEQSWIIEDLTQEEIQANKKPNVKKFSTQMIEIPELFSIYNKGRDGSLETQKWFNEVRMALINIYIPEGFKYVINNFASSIPLTLEEIELLNTYLYDNDLEIITWHL